MLIVDSTKQKDRKKIRTSQDTLIIIKALDFTGHPRIILKFTHNYTTKKKHSVVNKSTIAVKRRKIYSKFL
jgi:hypothetical protein